MYCLSKACLRNPEIINELDYRKYILVVEEITSMTNSGKYLGEELTLFEKAAHWKRYCGSFIKPYLRGRVLEVGAGLGGTTLSLCDGSQSEWLCLEPDSNLAQSIKKLISEKKLPECCACEIGTLKDIPSNRLFNAIIYMDVLEHIKDDKAELDMASRHLVDNGVLIVAAPAHQCLYSSFDGAIGHLRRYSRKQLLSILPENCDIKKAIYLDSVGLSLSLANRLFLKQNCPTEKQILFWDRIIIKLSRLVDPLFFYNFGKSIILIFQKAKSA